MGFWGPTSASTTSSFGMMRRECLDHIIVVNEQHLTGVTKATEEPSGCRGAGRGALARPLRNCAGWSRNAA